MLHRKSKKKNLLKIFIFDNFSKGVRILDDFQCKQKHGGDHIPGPFLTL